MALEELKAAMAREGISAEELAGRMNISETALFSRLQGDSEFKGSEIAAIAEMFGFTMAEVNQIFFDRNVN